jgi:release factor glutamine methyltransferase
VIVDRAAATLAEHGIESPRVDAEWIVAHVAGVSRSGLVAVSHEVDERDVERLVRRRAAREPLAYVLGEWGFRRLILRCDPRALVPRPETELLVERCMVRLQGVSAPRVLDVGTGTGAVALALADEAGAEVTATDISRDALTLAADNAARAGLNVQLVHGDVRDALPVGPWDAIVSNPPYVKRSEWDELSPEVRDWEPREALVDEGQTGAIVGAALSELRSGGALLLEVHEANAEAVAEAMRDEGYDDVTITRDLAGRERIVEGERT